MKERIWVIYKKNEKIRKKKTSIIARKHLYFFSVWLFFHLILPVHPSVFNEHFQFNFRIFLPPFKSKWTKYIQNRTKSILNLNFWLINLLFPFLNDSNERKETKCGNLRNNFSVFLLVCVLAYPSRTVS